MLEREGRGDEVPDTWRERPVATAPELALLRAFFDVSASRTVSAGMAVIANPIQYGEILAYASLVGLRGSCLIDFAALVRTLDAVFLSVSRERSTKETVHGRHHSPSART